MAEPKYLGSGAKGIAEVPAIYTCRYLPLRNDKSEFTAVVIRGQQRIACLFTKRGEVLDGTRIGRYHTQRLAGGHIGERLLRAQDW